MSVDPYSPPRAEPPSAISGTKASEPAWMRISLFSGLFYSLGMALVFGIKGPNHLSGIWTGLAGGLFFGPFMGVIARHQYRKAQANPPDTGGESPVFEGSVSRATSLKSSQIGYLILTSQRVLFRSNKAKPGEPDWSANLQEISRVELSKYFGTIPNRLRLIFPDGEFERFVVNDYRRWLATITAARDAALRSAARNGEPQV
ncbi:MAG: hypothetical protein JWO82_2706 [Akkermansiaceae bacterium]|nr:hypothetical protein [Akkermansiaceae bacterium]